MASFISLETGGATGTVPLTVPTCDLLVACVYSTDSSAGRSLDLDATSLDVANNSNGFAQLFYMLSPPSGSATLNISGTNVSSTVVAYYSGPTSFQAAQQSSAQTQTFTPSGAGATVIGVSTSSAPSGPITSTNERRADADWFGDRIVTGSGSVTIGSTGGADPDSVAGIFLDAVSSVTLSGGMTLGAATMTGDVDREAALSGGMTLGAATMTGDVDREAALSGGMTLGAATMTGDVDREADLSGGFATPVIAVSGSGELAVALSGGMTIGAVTMTGDVSVEVGLSGGSVLAPVTMTGALSSDGEADLSGGMTLGAATMTGSLSVEVGLSGGFALPPATVAGELAVALSLSGGLAMAPVTMTGEVANVINLAGGMALGSVAMAGQLSVPAPRVGTGSMRLRTTDGGSMSLSTTDGGTMRLRAAGGGGFTLFGGAS